MTHRAASVPMTEAFGSRASSPPAPLVTTAGRTARVEGVRDWRFADLSVPISDCCGCGRGRLPRTCSHTQPHLLPPLRAAIRRATIRAEAGSTPISPTCLRSCRLDLPWSSCSTAPAWTVRKCGSGRATNSTTWPTRSASSRFARRVPATIGTTTARKCGIHHQDGEHR